jgi:hypothetical protein
MPTYSDKSKANLATCHTMIQDVFNEVIKHFDCSIIWGFRGEFEQNEAFRLGNSQRKWPHSKHNQVPSMAIDAPPYPINWNNRDRFIYFAGHVLGIAREKGIPLIWGGDWDSDTILKDNMFNDLAHFELRAITQEEIYGRIY